MSTQLLALLRREMSGFTRGLSSSFYFKALRTLYKKGYWHLMNWIPETLHRSRLDFYMVEAVLHQYFEVIQSSRFFLKALLKKIVCELLLPRSHPVKHFSFPQSLCFPYLPYISVRSLCHGQACYMFSCTSARNYPWCCLLLSPSWQIDCISSLWAIHQKLIWAGLNERLHWSRCGALASPDLLNQQSRCNSCWQRLNHFPSTFLFSKRQDLVLS